MDILVQSSKRCFIAIIIVASICASTTWFVANAILVQPRDFTMTQLEKRIEHLENENKDLEDTISSYREQITSNARTNDLSPENGIVDIWKGIWLTTYRNGFSHTVEFQINDNMLIGVYDYANIRGEIIVNEISASMITAVWIQNEDNRFGDSGDLRFTLQSNRSFIGTYTKRSENYRRTYSWNGERIN